MHMYYVRPLTAKSRNPLQDTRSAESKQISCILKNVPVYSIFTKKWLCSLPPRTPTPHKMNPVHIFLPCFFKIYV
jgi:hypothetical protein